MSTHLSACAERPDIRAAYLVDPVDNTKQSPESPEFPSAAKALAACGREVGITGAGLVGSCNPEGSNYKVKGWAGQVPCRICVGQGGGKGRGGRHEGHPAAE